MKVSELIDFLQQFDPSQRVIVDGYESGFDDITSVKTQDILVDGNKVPRPGWGGNWVEIPHEYGSGAHETDGIHTLQSVRDQTLREKAVYIFSSDRK